MANKITYEDVVADLTDSEVEYLISLAKKRRRVYLVLLLLAWGVVFICNAITTRGVSLPFVPFITLPCLGIPSALGAYSHTFIVFLETKGHRYGGFGRFVWLFFGALIVPFIVLVILNHGGTKVLKSVLGWNKAEL